MICVPPVRFDTAYRLSGHRQLRPRQSGIRSSRLLISLTGAGPAARWLWRAPDLGGPGARQSLPPAQCGLPCGGCTAPGKRARVPVPAGPDSWAAL